MGFDGMGWDGMGWESCLGFRGGGAGFLRVVDHNSWVPPPSFSSQKFAPRFWFWTDFGGFCQGCGS